MTTTTSAAIPDMRASHLAGVALVLAAVFAFALGDTLTKHLTMLYAVPVVMATRYLTSLALLTLIAGPRQGRKLWQTRRTGLVFIRALSLTGASLSVGMALRLMPVGETEAVVYLAPLVVVLLAGPLLGEKVPFAGWIGATAGFIGVLVIARPGSGLDPVGVVYALITAGMTASYNLLSRVLARTETTIAMLFHTTLVGAVIFAGLALWSLDQSRPSVQDLGLMALLGGLTTVGHFLFTAAFREAPASIIAPVTYVQLVWAGVLGWLVFGHIPDGWSMFGMALVMGAGIMVALGARSPRKEIRR